MDVATYFQVLIWILMTTTFIALVLAFIHLFYSEEEVTD
jgi:hypothetical protein